MPAKVHLVKAVVFPVVMYGCESWTVKKAVRQRIEGHPFQVVRNPLAHAGDVRDMGSIPWLGRSPGKGNGNPLQ